MVQETGSVLVEMGFSKVRCDNSIWVYLRGELRIIVPAFVDNLTLVGNDKSEIQNVKDELRKRFKLRDLGPASFLLGVSIERDRATRTLKLGQRRYVLDLLERYGFSECSQVQTPVSPDARLDLTMSPATAAEKEEMRTVPYIHAVGSLMYLAISTRPDIAYVVGLLGRFSANPGKAHWNAVKHLFRYLKGTLDMKLTYAPTESSSSERFVTYTDADHGGCKDTGRSTGAYVVKVGTGAVSWSSKIQSIVTLSTTEAEYVAAVSAGQEIMWLRNLFSEIGFAPSGPSTLFVRLQRIRNTMDA